MCLCNNNRKTILYLTFIVVISLALTLSQLIQSINAQEPIENLTSEQLLSQQQEQVQNLCPPGSVIGLTGFCEQQESLLLQQQPQQQQQQPTPSTRSSASNTTVTTPSTQSNLQGSHGNGTGQLDCPIGTAVDSNGNCYVDIPLE
jgi:hypothetical protein